MMLDTALAIARVTGYAQVSLTDLERWHRGWMKACEERDKARNRAEEIREQADVMVKEAATCARQ